MGHVVGPGGPDSLRDEHHERVGHVSVDAAGGVEHRRQCEAEERDVETVDRADLAGSNQSSQ